jgi:hypothetical protein
MSQEHTPTLYPSVVFTIWIGSQVHQGVWGCVTWALEHPKYVFFFQNISEIDETQIPFTIGIQTPTQCESMLSYGHNGAISMDARFGTNDMKFHLFTLMGLMIIARMSL